MTNYETKSLYPITIDPTPHTNSIFNSVTYRFENIAIDPGDEQEWQGVKAILLTHAHFDHIYGLNILVEQNPDVRIYTNEAGKEILVDAKRNMSRFNETPFILKYADNVVVVSDGEEIVLADGRSARAIFTPGHNPSCITWQVEDCLFTGDSYIPGIKVVTNLPGADKKAAALSVEKILALQKEHNLRIYPGHSVPV